MLIDIISIALRVTVCCAVFAYFLFTPFQSRFRYSNFVTALLALLLTVLTAAVTVLFLSSGKFFVNYSTIGILLWIFCAVLLFHLAIKGSFFEILFIVLVILNLYVNIVAIAKVVVNSAGAFLNLSSDAARAVVVLGVLAAYIPFLWILLVKLYRQVIDFQVDFPFWKYLWIIPALTYTIFFVKIVSEYWKGANMASGTDVAFIILWSFTTYAFFFVTLEMLIQTYKGITAMQQTELTTAQMRMQADQYQRVLDNMEKTARLRHDWRHHLLSINSFVENADLTGLREYLKVLNLEYQGDDEVSVCENHVVNAILQHYRSIAGTGGITMTVNAGIQENLPVSDTDLCIVFGNLVENAVEACLSQTGGSRRISIKASAEDHQLVLVVQNTCQDGVVFKDGRYYSDKHEGVGIGLSSVERVVEKYNGVMKVDHGKGSFIVQVMLNMDMDDALS